MVLQCPRQSDPIDLTTGFQTDCRRFVLVFLFHSFCALFYVRRVKVFVIMRGVLVGDSQLKFLNRNRLQFAQHVCTCTFSVGSADTVTLLTNVQQWHLKSMDFVVIYVGSNDLSYGRDPWDICRDILVCCCFAFALGMYSVGGRDRTQFKLAAKVSQRIALRFCTEVQQGGASFSLKEQ